MDETHWPDGTKRSTNNGFTHGYLGRPHGFKPGPAAPSPEKAKRRQGGFARDHGTIAGGLKKRA